MRLTLLGLACLSVLGCAHPAEQRATAAVHSDHGAVTRTEFGALHFETSCSPDVRADFDRAIALLHHMTYPQARAAFRAVSERDPACAMAHWGVAMTLFQPLWPTRPGPADLRAGLHEAEAAQALRPPTRREAQYIESVAAFFKDPESADYWQRIDRWAAVLEAVHAANPADPEASAFYALALLATARPGAEVQEHSQRAVALLLPVYRQNPDHPGAMHYIVHADDVPGREREHLEIVRRYEQVAPDNPHALHMPTHIYTRLGDWDGVIRGNLRAAEAALRFPAGEHGELVWDEFAHAIEYLTYAYLQQGADAEAAAQVERLLATRGLEPTAKTAFHLASTQARYALERRAFAEAAALVPREPATLDWDRTPWPESISVFARAYGSLRLGDVATTAAALARLRELEQRAGAAGETVFARQIQVLRLDLEAFSAHAAGNDAQAIRTLQEAVALEGATPKPPVTPAATLPAPELLGELLLELKRPSEAVAAYRESLARFPRRFNSTLGLARALAGTGDRDAALQAYCQLLELGAHGQRAASLEDTRGLADSCRK